MISDCTHIDNLLAAAVNAEQAGLKSKAFEYRSEASDLMKAEGHRLIAEANTLFEDAVHRHVSQ